MDSPVEGHGLKVAVHQPNYLPWLGFFAKMAAVDTFIILDTAQFTKNSYQNRVNIKTPDGAQWLSQPVILADRAFKPTNEVSFADDAWGKKHLKSLQANYGRSKYFKEYFAQLSGFLDKPGPLLSELNLRLIDWAAKILNIKTIVRKASEFPSSLAGTERLVELIRAVNGGFYLSGKGGTNYQDPALFEQAGIKLEVSEYNCRPYPQLWGDFIPGLSVIDLIFNCGPDGRKYL